MYLNCRHISECTWSVNNSQKEPTAQKDAVHLFPEHNFKLIKLKIVLSSDFEGKSWMEKKMMNDNIKEIITILMAIRYILEYMKD